MTLNTILKRILSKGGITLDANGNEFKRDRGYMVSLAGYETKLELGTHQFTAQLSRMLQAKQELARKMNCKVGLWVHEGNVYADLSEYHVEYDSALQAAINAKQLAFFDFYDGQAINTQAALRA